MQDHGSAFGPRGLVTILPIPVTQRQVRKGSLSLGLSMHSRVHHGAVFTMSECTDGINNMHGNYVKRIPLWLKG